MRRDEINAECHDLREQAISHISETRLLEEKRAEILEETAVEKQRGRAWETKLRQAGSETRELRKVLDEEETKCKERIAIEKQRGRHSLEWSGLQQALARVSMVSDSQSLRESMLMRTSSRQGKLTEELRTAEALHHDIKGQVSDPRPWNMLIFYMLLGFSFGQFWQLGAARKCEQNSRNCKCIGVLKQAWSCLSLSLTNSHFHRIEVPSQSAHPARCRLPQLAGVTLLHASFGQVFLVPSLVWNVDLGIMWNRKTFPLLDVHGI